MLEDKPEHTKQLTELMPELTQEQWEDGRKIAELCGFDEDILETKMLWGDSVGSVGWGLSHSAQHIIEYKLNADQIRDAVERGIAAYQEKYGGLGGDS